MIRFTVYVGSLDLQQAYGQRLFDLISRHCIKIIVFNTKQRLKQFLFFLYRARATKNASVLSKEETPGPANNDIKNSIFLKLCSHPPRWMQFEIT